MRFQHHFCIWAIPGGHLPPQDHHVGRVFPRPNRISAQTLSLSRFCMRNTCLFVGRSTSKRLMKYSHECVQLLEGFSNASCWGAPLQHLSYLMYLIYSRCLWNDLADVPVSIGARWYGLKSRNRIAVWFSSQTSSSYRQT